MSRDGGSGSVLGAPHAWTLRSTTNKIANAARITRIPEARCLFRKYTASPCGPEGVVSFPRRRESRRCAHRLLDARLRGHDVFLAMNWCLTQVWGRVGVRP